MTESKKTDTARSGPGYVLILFCIGIVLLMFKSNRILYVRYIQDFFFFLFSFALMLPYAVTYRKSLERVSMFKGICILLLCAIFFYERGMLADLTSRAIICMLITMFGGAMLIMAPLEHKKVVLRVLTISVEAILLIALIGWIPFLLGVDLPHFRDTSDVYYMHQVYYIFNTFSINSPDDVRRFAGPFLEPGHLGTMCVYLLYINGCNLKKFGNIILFVSTIMSLSLAAYGMLIGAVILILIEKRKYWAVGIVSTIVLAIGSTAAAFLNGDNVLNKAIVSRLEMTESGDIAGNNRYTTFFEDTYSKYLNTDKIWLGVGKGAYTSKNKSSGNLMMGNAGYKRYFYLRGIVGTSLLLIFMALYYSRYHSLKSFGFLLIYVISNLIRDYPAKEIWMYLFLIAIPILYFEGRTPKKYKNKKKQTHSLHIDTDARPTSLHGPQLCK